MGMIDQLDTAGALPVLDAAIRFAGARHTVIAHNIANLETPGFQPRDVDPHAFQSELAEAIDRRRQGETGSIGGTHGELGLETTREVEVGAGGRLRLNPRTSSGNILFHDRNNRDLELLMQDLAENLAAYQVATDLMRSQMGTIGVAISQRV